MHSESLIDDEARLEEGRRHNSRGEPEMLCRCGCGKYAGFGDKQRPLQYRLECRGSGEGLGHDLPAGGLRFLMTGRSVCVDVVRCALHCAAQSFRALFVQKETTEGIAISRLGISIDSLGIRKDSQAMKNKQCSEHYLRCQRFNAVRQSKECKVILESQCQTAGVG